jgi:hypothetical protein
MTDFDADPEAAVAALIATLPDDFGELQISQLEAIAEAHRALLEIMQASTDAANVVLDRIRPRFTSPDQTLGEVATDAERAKVDGLNRRYLAAERAADALRRWEERSGASNYGLPPVHPEEREPLFAEEPDGTLTVRVRDIDDERANRPPTTLLLKDGRRVQLPDVAPNAAHGLIDAARALGEKIGGEIDPDEEGS